MGDRLMLEKYAYGKALLKLSIFMAVWLIPIDSIRAVIMDSKINWSFIIPFTIFWSLINAFKYSKKIAEFPIEDSKAFKVHLKTTLETKGWLVKEQEKDSFIIKPRWHDRILLERVVVYISENKVQMTGAVYYIEQILKMMNLK